MHGPEPEDFDPSTWDGPPAYADYAESNYKRERDNCLLHVIWQRFYAIVVKDAEEKRQRKLTKEELRTGVEKYSRMLADHYGRSRPDRAFEERMADKAEREARGARQ